MKKLTALIVASTTLLGAGAAGGYAIAAPHRHVLALACVASRSRAITAPVGQRCPLGSLLETVGAAARGKTGPQGRQGSPGPTGRQGSTGKTGPAGKAGATGKTGATGKSGPGTSYIVNWQKRAILNATTGITLTSDITDATADTETVGLKLPVDISACGVSVTPVTTNTPYPFASGTPQVQAFRTSSSATLLTVVSKGPTAPGVDFSVTVICP